MLPYSRIPGDLTYQRSGSSSTLKYTIYHVSRTCTLAVCLFSPMRKSVSPLVHLRLSQTQSISCLAGKDATDAFFSLHRYEVLERPQYKRLQIGVIQGEESILHGRVIGEISKVPYAEPTWLSPGYHSPYYSEVYSVYCAYTTRSSHGSSTRIIGGSKRLCASSLILSSCQMPRPGKRMENDHRRV